MLVKETLTFFLLVGAAFGQGPPKPDYGWDTETPLDRYVHNYDGAYHWEVLESFRYNDSVTVHVVNMTSQYYANRNITDTDVWYHYMSIAIPDNVTYDDAAFMLIDGGSSNPNNWPDREDACNVGMAVIAQQLGIVAACIGEIPNQPIVYKDRLEQGGKSEDTQIAYTWRHFYDDPNRDPSIVARSTFTKATKSGLDCIEDVARWHSVRFNIQDFYVTGASKRGWTTWSLAAVDKRVKAIAPIVFSLLHFEETLQAHFRAMNGAWSFALRPYYAENLTMVLTDPAAGDLFDLEDMYRYRSRFAGRPKYLISAAGDEFFHTQDTLTWWDDMPDPKYYFLCRNTEHAMVGCYADVGSTIAGFFLTILQGGEMPKLTWSSRLNDDGQSGTITLTANPQPIATQVPDDRCDPDDANGIRHEIRGFSAITLDTDSRRDWRLVEGYPDQVPHPVFWYCNTSRVLDVANGYTFEFESDIVDNEWNAYMIEGVWEGPSGLRMYMTTQPHIIPETYPREEPCVGEECYGYLV